MRLARFRSGAQLPQRTGPPACCEAPRLLSRRCNSATGLTLHGRRIGSSGVRSSTFIVACVLAAMGVACHNATGADPKTCLGSTATFSPTTPDFVAPVSNITIERGWTPAGFYMVQYDLFLARPPATAPDVGVMLSDTGPNPTPVFERAADGTLSPSTVCSIKVGDVLDVWHTRFWALGSAEAPPGDTAFEAVQVVIHR
jgi:hypothetical protein